MFMKTPRFYCWLFLAILLNSIAVSAQTVTTSSLPNGIATLPYPTVTFTATGGVPPYTWSATGLPPGMNLSPIGILSGIPTTAGTFTIILTVTDSSGKASPSASLATTISPAPTAPNYNALMWNYTQGTDLGTGFNVWRSPVTGGPYTLQNPTPLPLASLIFIDSTGTPGNMYYYVVTAVDANGLESVYSTEAAAVMVGAPQPQPPSSLGVIQIAQGNIIPKPLQITVTPANCKSQPPPVGITTSAVPVGGCQLMANGGFILYVPGISGVSPIQPNAPILLGSTHN
jgi:hypothetical protein